MKRTLLVLTALLAAAAGPSTRPAHDRDPWIFRCVLDDNARMLVLSLGNDVWAAYDTEHCTLAKLWVGDVNFTGAVFDTKHGPQPHARGTMLLEQPISLVPAAPGTTPAAATGHVDGYRGYRVNGDTATLQFDFNGVTINETLSVGSVDQAAKSVTLTRKIDVAGTVSGDKPVALVATTSPNAAVKLVGGSIATGDGKDKLTSPAAVDAAAQQRLIVSEPQTITLEMSFSNASK